MLWLKMLIKDIILCYGSLYLINKITDNIKINIIVIFGFVINYIIQFVLFYKPLQNMYKALKHIDFEQETEEPVNLIPLKKLKRNSIKEINIIIQKLQHIAKTLYKGIDSLNTQVDKSTHDALSGCYNVEYWNEMKNNYSMCNSVCIIFIDVNNLKKMNDIYGHEAGDALIKASAKKLEWWQGKGDVFRMGGDEFMVVITNKTQEECKYLINSWYPTVGRLNRNTDGFACVFSYGVAYGYQNCDIDALRKEADERMYNHKVKIKQALGEPMR